MNRLVLYGVGLAAIIGLLWFAHHTIWHAGYDARTSQDAAALARLEKIDHAQAIADTKEVGKEAKEYVEAIHTPVTAPVVRVCNNPRPARVPVATETGRTADAATEVRSEPAPDIGIDIGQPVVQEGHNADAQVIALQAYITNVCRPR